MKRNEFKQEIDNILEANTPEIQQKLINSLWKSIKPNKKDVSCGKSKCYLDEINKQNILDDLKRIEKYVCVLYNMLEKSNYLDNKTKQNIFNLKKTSYHIYEQEINKELNHQKKDGKEFLSSDDVDGIINKIINDK